MISFRSEMTLAWYDQLKSTLVMLLLNLHGLIQWICCCCWVGVFFSLMRVVMERNKLTLKINVMIYDTCMLITLIWIWNVSNIFKTWENNSFHFAAVWIHDGINTKKQTMKIVGACNKNGWQSYHQTNFVWRTCGG